MVFKKIFQKKRIVKKRSSSGEEESKPLLKRLGSVLLFLIVLTIGANFARNIIRLQKSKERIMGLADEVEGIKEENKKLEENLDYLGSEEFIEKEAREKLDMVKEGETLVILPEEIYLEEEEDSKKKEFEGLTSPQKWQRLFLGND